ncbi:DUF418 domain-containing protein [Sediminibacillus massiliensis]|uniref:DUF418 domain-containing protein n=1 Tax=Sediminibacillus massiliensis TaxID=1926277 RepID=UPI0009888E08|nr:DUF418 domain-containing protein [Sediminibacillus massiliensis]
MEHTGTPIGEGQRLQWIDAARGLAIFGIFMVNVPAYNAPFFQYGGEKAYWDNPADHFVQNMIDIFFQASFYTLFSFLFGFGMQIMMERLAEKRLHPQRVIFRRLIVLTGFGLVHAFFIWHGDILLSYGLIGMLLFFFFKRKDKTILLWSVLLLVIPVLLFTWLLFLVREYGMAVDQQAIYQAMHSYGEGTYGEILKQNYQDWIYVNGGINYLFLAINLLPLFLLGILAARKKWLHDITLHLSFLKKVWAVTAVVFAVCKAGPYLLGNPEWLSIFQDSIGGSASALFYVSTVTLLYQKESWRKILRPLTYVGRMSLTNYLLQSVVCFFLFYSIGLGLYGEVRPVYSVLIVLIIFCLQVAASKVWFKHYRFGPVEGLWRTLTYGRMQKMRKARE